MGRGPAAYAAAEAALVTRPNAERRLRAAAASLRTHDDGRLVLLADQVDHVADQVRAILEEGGGRG